MTQEALEEEALEKTLKAALSGSDKVFAALRECIANHEVRLHALETAVDP
jgi:predicted component of type VI protein secretion system